MYVLVLKEDIAASGFEVSVPSLFGIPSFDKKQDTNGKGALLKVPLLCSQSWKQFIESYRMAEGLRAF